MTAGEHAAPRVEGRLVGVPAVAVGAVPAAAVVAAAVGSLLAYGVGGEEIIRWALYELLYVVVPGLVALGALSWRRPALERFAVGWALGYALEIMAFAVTGMLGVRAVFVAYPVPWLVAAAVVAYRRRRLPMSGIAEGVAGCARSTVAWGAAALSVTLLLYHALTFFADVPLPWQVAEARYELPDPLFNLALAAEALHHWPVQDPSVSGLAYPYHIWAHLHIAAVADVTGIALPTVVFRLFPVPLTILFVLLLVAAGRRIVGSAAGGVVAAVLVTLVGELDLVHADLAYRLRHPGSWEGFVGHLPNIGLTVSPSFALGMAFFVPVLMLIVERLRVEGPIRPAWREWTLLVLFLIGCAGAKASMLPVVIGGLVLVLALGLLRRRVDRRVVAAFGASAGVFLLSWALVYHSSGTWGSELDPPGTVRQMALVLAAQDKVGDVLPGAAFWAPATVFGLFGAFAATLAGVPVVLRRFGRSLPLDRQFLLACFVASLVPFLLFTHIGTSQTFFAHHGLVAAAFVSAEGFVLLAAAVSRSDVRSLAGFAGFAVAWLGVLLLLAGGLTWWVDPAGGAVFWLVAALAVPTLAVLARAGAGRVAGIALAVLLAALLVLVRADAFGPVAAAYGFLLAGTAVLLVLFLRADGPARARLGLAAAAAVALAGALNLPLDETPAERRLHREVLRQEFSVDATPDLFAGLDWVRTHTSPADIIAVNNQWEFIQRKVVTPTNSAYTALAERRTFLGAYGLSLRATKIGFEQALYYGRLPFPVRLRLNMAVFMQGDRAALQLLVRDYDVRWLVVDRRAGEPNSALFALGCTVFQNRALVVLAVDRDLSGRCPRGT